MPGIRVKEGESIESALKRFKKATEKAGILSEIRKREHYEKPSVKRKKKALAAKKRAVKKLRKIYQHAENAQERDQVQRGRTRRQTARRQGRAPGDLHPDQATPRFGRAISRRRPPRAGGQGGTGNRTASGVSTLPAHA